MRTSKLFCIALAVGGMVLPAIGATAQNEQAVAHSPQPITASIKAPAPRLTWVKIKKHLKRYWQRYAIAAVLASLMLEHMQTKRASRQTPTKTLISGNRSALERFAHYQIDLLISARRWWQTFSLQKSLKMLRRRSRREGPMSPPAQVERPRNTQLGNLQRLKIALLQNRFIEMPVTANTKELFIYPRKTMVYYSTTRSMHEQLFFIKEVMDAPIVDFFWPHAPRGTKKLAKLLLLRGPYSDVPFQGLLTKESKETGRAYCPEWLVVDEEGECYQWHPTGYAKYPDQAATPFLVGYSVDQLPVYLKTRIENSSVYTTDPERGSDSPHCDPPYYDIEGNIVERSAKGASQHA